MKRGTPPGEVRIAQRAIDAVNREGVQPAGVYGWFYHTEPPPDRDTIILSRYSLAAAVLYCDGPFADDYEPTEEP